MDKYPKSERYIDDANLPKAVQLVESLAFDEGFVNIIKKHSLYIESTVDQEHGTEYCLENTKAFRQSNLVNFLDDSPYFVAEDTSIRMTARGEFYNLSGQTTINDSTITFSSYKGNLFATVAPDLSPIPIDPDDISELLLATLSGQVTEEPEIIEKSLHADELEEKDNSWERLARIISASGNIYGRSTRTIYSIIPKINERIAIELIEVETPEGSDIHNHLQRVEESDIFADIIGLRHSESAPPDLLLPALHTAYHARESLSKVDYFLEQTRAAGLPPSHAVTIERNLESSQKEIEHYTLLCEDFIRSLQNALDPSNPCA